MTSRDSNSPFLVAIDECNKTLTFKYTLAGLAVAAPICAYTKQMWPLALFGGVGSAVESGNYALCVAEQLSIESRKRAPIDLPETGPIGDRAKLELERKERQTEIVRLKAQMEAIEKLKTQTPK